MSIDFARIIADAIEGTSNSHPFAATAVTLAARLPDLCPDCHGDTRARIDIGFERGHSVACTHSDAPSIGKLLAIGAAVLNSSGEGWPWSWHDETLKPDDPMVAYWLGADRMLAYLRAVGDD